MAVVRSSMPRGSVLSERKICVLCGNSKVPLHSTF